MTPTPPQATLGEEAPRSGALPAMSMTDERPFLLAGAAGVDPAPRVLPLPGRPHAGLQRRGRDPRVVRQGAGRGAVFAGDVEHLRDRPPGVAGLPAAGLSAGLPDRHHDARLGDPGLHLRAAAALDVGAGAHLRL